MAWIFSTLALLDSRTAAHSQSTRQPATLRVLVPAADAQLWVDDVPTRQRGALRRFFSPPLEPGKTFHYTITVRWEPNNYTTITRTREVEVWAGQETQADLRRADAKQPDRIVIRYVPTPPDVVEVMLRLAGVAKDDVVYDLGCGDGRIVISAVAQFHARRGIGFDLDPQRIQESRAKARRVGVEERVEFRQGDVLDIKDFSAASVVTVYMSDALNKGVRPALQKTLKPGARVVSHRFTMGDWKPTKSIRMIGRDGDTYDLHLWVIGPARAPK
jgi:uncharacterized protein (TIGR03000 family)